MTILYSWANDQPYLLSNMSMTTKSVLRDVEKQETTVTKIC